MSVTVKELARKVGVSTSVVYRYARGDNTLRISDERRLEIKKVAERLGGIRVNRAARSLAGGLALAVVAPISRLSAGNWGLEYETSLSFTRHLEEALKLKGVHFHLKFLDPDRKVETIQEWIDTPGLCGGLLLLSGMVDEPLARLILDRRIPHVSDARVDERFGVNTVLAHAAGALRKAIQHLRQLGHSRIGWLGPRQYRWPVFFAAMAEENLSVDIRGSCVFIEPTGGGDLEIWRRLGREHFARWLQGGPPATAMICSNDSIALGAVDAMRQHGLTPGRDLSLVGYDNIEQRWTAWTDEPILTTIDNPRDIIGSRCGELLINQMFHGQRQVVHEQIPTKLIIRQTTGPVRAGQSSREVRSGKGDGRSKANQR